MRANESMVLSKQALAFVAALLMALACVGDALQEHDAHVGSAGHPDCDACHCRHLSVVQTDGTPASPAPDLVVHAVAATHPDGELGKALGIQPTRGPPA